ncbi:MAG: arsenate reductase ArsC [Gammaproteobacteria bacterium]|nr:arsenate reductase ArsC [Gammaproteobacteria bacterium]
MKNILILCTGNSCRSIMAEALINQLGKGHYIAESAGSNPTGYIHPKTIDTLIRHKIEIGEPRSKSWHEFVDRNIDLIITVCDQAANENCPIFSGNYKKLHWSIPDPANCTGTKEDINLAFDGALQKLKQHIEDELI